jgi:hypothetical protein
MKHPAPSKQEHGDCMKRTGAVIFHPPTGTSELEQMVASARLAATRDLIESVRPLVSTVVVIANPSSIPALEPLDVHAMSICGTEEFHFGEVLQAVIRDRELEGVLYFGSGSGVLLQDRELRMMVDFAQKPGPAALFNNFYSCDFAAFSEASFLLHRSLPETDNGIGFLLADSGVHCYSLSRSLTTQFDLDTPIDVLLLQASNRGGPYLRAYLDAQPIEHPTLGRISDTLVEREALVYLVGRLSPVTWQAFETQVACRTAGIVEGRGMKAYARRHPPILPRLSGKHGFKAFFAALADSADAAIIDSRPLLAHDGRLPDPHERFSSDLFRISELRDPAWLEFTRHALECRIPILLGGHSLVSGGLYLLSQICWKERNLPRRLHPDPYEGDGN